MSITNPNNYPERTGVDPRDENHPQFPKKIVKVYIKPLAHRVIEKDLWFEVVFILMVLMSGVGALMGRVFQIEWFVIMFTSLAFIGIKTFKRLGVFIDKEEPKEELLPVTQPADGDGSIS